MYSLVILTAMSATSGLFGGGGCHTGFCGRPVITYAPTCGPKYVVSGCSQGYVCPAPVAAPAPVVAPAPAPSAQAVPAPAMTQMQAYPVAPPAYHAAYFAPSHYFTAAPACASGNCAAR
jgi:hypothetical protein